MAKKTWITLGARKILRLLETHQISALKFAQLAGLNRITFHNVLHGQTKGVSVDFALACKRASHGAVEVEDFASSTALKEDADEEIVKRLAAAAKKNGAARRRTNETRAA